MFMLLFFIVALAVLVVASQNRHPGRWEVFVTAGLCLLVGLQLGTLLPKSCFAQELSETAAADSQAADSQAVDSQAVDSGDDQGKTGDPGNSDERRITDEAEQDGQAEPQLQAEVADSSEVDELSTLEIEASENDSSSIERMASYELLDRDRYPDWLIDPPAKSDFSLASSTSEDDVQSMVVESTPCMTQAECQRDLDRSLRVATDDYINEYLNSPRASMLLRYSIDDIRDRLVTETFEEGILLTRYGKRMLRAHALVGFDHAFRQDLDRRWDQVVATMRLMQTGLGSGIVLALLGTMFGYFRFDTATRGYYTGRLQFAAAAAILAVAAAGVLVAKWIPWM